MQSFVFAQHENSHIFREYRFRRDVRVHFAVYLYRKYAYLIFSADIYLTDTLSYPVVGNGNFENRGVCVKFDIV